MKQLLLSRNEYSHPQFEEFFEKLQREEMSLAEVSAQQHGLANKPSNILHYKIQLKNFFTAIQKGIDFNYSLFRPVSNIASTKELRNSATENISVMEKDKNDKDKKLEIIKHEQHDLKGTLNYLSPKLILLVAALFGLSEGVLVYTILQSASYSGVVKFFLSLAIAIAAAFGVHLGANYICKAKTKMQRIKRFALVIGLALLVAGALGVWRASLYSTSANINAQLDVQNAATESIQFSSLPFIAISFISFLVALAFEIRFWLSDEQKAKIKQYNDKVAEAKKIEKEKLALKKQIDDTKDSMANTSADILSQQEYAYSNERRLLTLAQLLQTKYEAVNIEYRLDNTCPAFFGQPFSHEFKLYFHDIFNNIKPKR